MAALPITVPVVGAARPAQTTHCTVTVTQLNTSQVPGWTGSVVLHSTAAIHCLHPGYKTLD